VDDKQSTDGVREALENTDKVLRRLSRAVESAKDGGEDKQQTIALWLRRSRRQLRSNRTLLGESGPEDAAEANDEAEDEPKAKAPRAGARRRAAAGPAAATAAGGAAAAADGDDAPAPRPRRRAAARARAGRRGRGGGRE